MSLAMRVSSRQLLLILFAGIATTAQADESPFGALRPVIAPPQASADSDTQFTAILRPQNSPSDQATTVAPPAPRSQNPVVAPSVYGPNRTASVSPDGLQIPTLIAPTTSVTGIGDERIPENIGENALQDQITLPEVAAERAPDWSLTSYFWQAPNTYSHPLYFEDVMLERHGHERYRALQPLVSGAKFFATIPALPYLMTVRPACDFDFHLGYFRPGSCAPALRQRPPYDRRAAVVQAGATAGAILLIP